MIEDKNIGGFPELKGEIWSIDFDGTLCTHAYPDIGPPNEEFIESLKKHKENGGYLILWTCRTGEDLEKAVKWCKKQGLQFNSINEDIPEIKSSEYGKNKSVKIFAHKYFDDRAEKIVISENRVNTFLKTYLPK